MSATSASPWATPRCKAAALADLADCDGSAPDAVRIVDRLGESVTACVSHGAVLLRGVQDARVELGPGGQTGDAIVCYRAAFPGRSADENGQAR